MRSIVLRLYVAFMVLVLMTLGRDARADTLNFDDVSIPYQYTTNYHGFEYGGLLFSDNMSLLNFQYYSSSGQDGGSAASGENAAITNWVPGFAAVSRGGLQFAFIGTSIEPLNGDRIRNPVAMSGTITGFLNDVEVGSVSYLNVTDWTAVITNFTLVDKVVITGSAVFGNNDPTPIAFAIDDLQVNYSPQAVPEPSSIALAGLGGIVLAFGAYRRQSTKTA